MSTIDINQINPNAQLSPALKSEKVELMKAEIGKICHSLSVPNKVFNAKDVYNALENYTKKYERLLYAEISTYCYNLNSEELDNFQGNLNCLIEYVYSRDYENGVCAKEGLGRDEEVKWSEKAKRITIKLYDNVNLACAQMGSLKQSEDELHQHFTKELQPAKEEITKEMSSQLITLVGIFTAIAFLVFGGFSSLTDVFAHIGDNIAKTIMLASIWGLIICNGVFIFLGCVEKIVQKSPSTLLFNKNKLFSWTNLILLFLFASSLWAYIIDKYNWGGLLIDFGQSSNGSIATCGFIFIIFIFGIIGNSINKHKDN